MTTELSIKFKQRHDDIQGRIEFPADNLFTLECLALMLTEFAKQVNLPVAVVINDLHSIVADKVIKRKGVLTCPTY